MSVTLSDEQSRMVDAALDGKDVIVDAVVGAGKTTSIQALCTEAGRDQNVLYLTYSKLLKADAQQRVQGARVQNYHGIVYPYLLGAGINVGISESIAAFNRNFGDLSATFPRYDMVVVDEYQDITEEHATLLANIKSVNPLMQVVFVGDMAQKVRSDTNLDVQAFVKGFCDDPALLPFTQSFRMGPEMGALLSQAWNKPVVGVNEDQDVRHVEYEEALDIISTRRPSDLLCLGKRNGPMPRALNTVESRRPDVFNKNTVYASIRDGDSSVLHSDDSAVFTTYDASKGLERSTTVVFDFGEIYWDMRSQFPDADHSVLRNIFLVAASRGKDEVIFVRGSSSEWPRSEPGIGAVPVRRFSNLPRERRPVYDSPWWASGMFDFKYAENVEACFALLDVVREDDGSGDEIVIDRSEGLIDLSPVVGHYQEAVFFDSYDAVEELLKDPGHMATMLISDLNGEAWHDSLVLTAVSTEQLRYVNQVTSLISAAVRDALVHRLGALLPRNCDAQVHLSLSGHAAASRTIRTPVSIKGVADAILDDVVYELKFVTELTHPMFLQLAMYLVMGDCDEGVLWNTRTDERWRVRVPDRSRFLDAVVLCVTKQRYKAFEGSGS